VTTTCSTRLSRAATTSKIPVREEVDVRVYAVRGDDLYDLTKRSAHAPVRRVPGIGGHRQATRPQVVSCSFAQERSFLC
jgi:hypothetical protein